MSAPLQRRSPKNGASARSSWELLDRGEPDFDAALAYSVVAPVGGKPQADGDFNLLPTGDSELTNVE